MPNRDDFTKKVKDIIAKRVGYLCSNPQCRKHTIGPHESPDKSSTIGIAAHITAASLGGPRYNKTLSTAERSSIDNGIWLCSNCAALIDKDEVKYPVSLLEKWKRDSESEVRRQIEGDGQALKLNRTPFLEADLIWDGAGRRNLGYSNKNPSKIIIGEDYPIIYWELNWKYMLSIYNNSSIAAFNISLKVFNEPRFQLVASLNKINNLAPLDNLDFKATSIYRMEGTSHEADEVLKGRIPSYLVNLQIQIGYQDEDRREHTTIVEIQDGEVINRRV